MGYAVIAILILLVILVIWIFNRLVAARQLVNNGWSDIDVQLKRRADLIPQLVETVKGYAGHEKKLFREVTEKRNEALKAEAPVERANAEAALKAPIGKLLAIAEDYPDLKANTNFLDLQDELSDKETAGSECVARRFCNGAVRQKNILVQSFPSNLFAGIFGFKAREYFEMDEAPVLPELDFES